MKKHEERKHGMLRVFKCDYCGKICSGRVWMKKHVGRNHGFCPFKVW